MRCTRHAACNRGQQNGCLFSGDGAANVKNDRLKFEYEPMAQSVEPGVRGVRTYRQYQRLLKRKGLTDDVPTREIAKMVTNTSYRERVREQGIQRVTERVREACLRAIQEGRPIQSEQQRQLYASVERVCQRG